MIATVLGYLGTVCLVLSFQCKQERRLFLLQLASGLLFVLHYGLSGDYSGMAMEIVFFIRALALCSDQKALTGRIAEVGFLITIVVVGVLTWQDIFSLFPLIALFGSTIFLFTQNTDTIRRGQFFVTSPAWLTYNIAVGSVPGILCECLDMGSVALYVLRTRLIPRFRKKDPPPAETPAEK